MNSQVSGPCLSLKIIKISTLYAHYGYGKNKENASQPRYSDTRIMWKELLHTGEIIGQCRALGVHVLAGNLTLTELIKYRKNIENIVTTITVYLESPACQRHLSGQCKVCVEQFLTFLREQLFEGDCDLSAIEYFNFASDVIEIVYEQYDIEMLRLHRRIE